MTMRHCSTVDRSMACKGPGVVKMDQARITSHQGAQGHHSVRGKASAHGATPANSASPDAATAGDFMSVLATLDDGLLADPLAPSDGGLVVGTDGAAQDATDAAALA